MAPPDLGHFSNCLLVGMFGSGKIAAFNPQNGHFRGFLHRKNGRALIIDGLWGIGFGNGGIAGPANVLYFAAGIEDEAHGLFGAVTVRNAHDDGDHDDDDR